MNKPFLLKPSDYLWGGNRINDDFGKNINLSPIAESWECSIHPDGPSYAKTKDDAEEIEKKITEELNGFFT